MLTLTTDVINFGVQIEDVVEDMDTADMKDWTREIGNHLCTSNVGF